VAGSTNYPASLDSHTGGDPYGFAVKANHLETELDGSLTSSATTITVLSTTGFPTRGSIVIGSIGAEEVVTYTGTSATTFTGCTRGADGTTAVAHDSGTSVVQAPAALDDNDKAAAIVAIETKLGTGASTPSNNTVLRGTGSGTTDYGQATSSHIANHTAVPANAPSSSGPGTYQNFLDWFSNRIAAITGGANWWTAPVATLTSLFAKFHDSTGHTHAGSGSNGPPLATAGLAANAATQSNSVHNGTSQATTSSTYVDVTGASITITTTGGPVLVIFTGTAGISATNGTAVFGFSQDGASEVGGCYYDQHASASENVPVSGLYRFTPSAASHTYKLRMKVLTAGTLTLQQHDFVVVELKR
jgi:hypothetical protein